MSNFPLIDNQDFFLFLGIEILFFLIKNIMYCGLSIHDTLANWNQHRQSSQSQEWLGQSKAGRYLSLNHHLLDEVPQIQRKSESLLIVSTRSCCALCFWMQTCSHFLSSLQSPGTPLDHNYWTKNSSYYHLSLFLSSRYAYTTSSRSLFGISWSPILFVADDPSEIVLTSGKRLRELSMLGILSLSTCLQVHIVCGFSFCLTHNCASSDYYGQ